MKRLWVSVFLLILLLSVCWLGNAAANQAAAEMNRQLSYVKGELHSGNLSTALAASQSLGRQWENEHRKLCTFMPHGELTDIEETLSMLPALIQTGETGQAEAQCSLAEAQLNRLSESESVTLDNLL